MADATKDDFTYDKDPTVKTVEVDLPFDGVTCQVLVNGIREFEAELDQLDREIMITATGKDVVVPALEFVGITLTMQNGWTLAFAARPGPAEESMSVKQGNFLGVGGVIPLTPTAFTQVTIRQSQAPTVAEGGGVTEEQMVTIAGMAVAAGRSAGLVPGSKGSYGRRFF